MADRPLQNYLPRPPLKSVGCWSSVTWTIRKTNFVFFLAYHLHLRPIFSRWCNATFYLSSIVANATFLIDNQAWCPDPTSTVVNRCHSQSPCNRTLRHPLQEKMGDIIASISVPKIPASAAPLSINTPSPHKYHQLSCQSFSGKKFPWILLFRLYTK